MCASMERYRKGSGDNPHQSQTPKEMEREGWRMERETEVATGNSIWRKGEGRWGDRGRVDEGMEQSGLALIELGSVVYIL